MNTSGTLKLNQTSLSVEAGILTELDFGARHEIAVGGLTITSATLRVLLNDAASSDFSVTSPVIGTGTKSGVALASVQTRVTDVSMVANSRYILECSAALSDGLTTLVEGIQVVAN